jgi:hypothetical protein
VVAVAAIAQPLQQSFSPPFYPSGEPAGKFCALIIKSRLGVVWKSTGVGDISFAVADVDETYVRLRAEFMFSGAPEDQSWGAHGRSQRPRRQ